MILVVTHTKLHNLHVMRKLEIICVVLRGHNVENAHMSLNKHIALLDYFDFLNTNERQS
jgi:hypothetical protein